MPNTREKLIELLANDDCPMFMVFGESMDGLVDYLIANGVTFAEGNNVLNKWIPVTERLPKEGEDVLVFGYYHETFQTLICHYRADFKGQWFTSVAGQQVYAVTHWMPLPQPPKGE